MTLIEYLEARLAVLHKQRRALAMVTNRSYVLDGAIHATEEALAAAACAEQGTL